MSERVGNGEDEDQPNSMGAGGDPGAVVLVGGVTLADAYQRHLPMQRRRVALVPWGDWGFGVYGYSVMSGTTVVYHEEWKKHGFFMIRVK